MLSVAPYVNQVKLNRELRNFAKTVLVEQDIDEKFELYELPHHALPELLRRIESIVAFGKGISILPNIFLMGLVSSYDAYLSDLIRTVLNVRLDIISSSEKSISLKELVEIGSVHDARQRIIDKEIDGLMRESHAAHVEWIENKLGTKIKHNNPIWSQYIELFERRNLLSHTAGIISPQYMKVCAEHGVDVSTLRAGSSQNVTPKYLVASVDLLAEFGVKLLQVVWRKTLPSEANDAAAILNETGFELIAKKRYGLASRLLKFGLEEQSVKGKESTRKMMVVNYANAVKLDGDKDAALRILNREDWSATSGKFKICVMAVKDDITGVISMMKSVTEDDQVKPQDFRNWPVFETLRLNAEFIKAFEATFGQRLLSCIAKDSI